MIQKIKGFFFKHKIISFFILAIIVGLIFILAKPNSSASVNYITQLVEIGDINVSVSGSGQISSQDTADISSEVSGNITNVYVKAGESVMNGGVLFKIDTTSQLQTIKTAEINLAKAELELEELQEPVDELTLMQAENSLIESNESKTKAEESLVKAYEDGFNTVSNTFIDLPTIMKGLDSLLFDSSIDEAQENITWYINQTDFTTDERERGLDYREIVYTLYNQARDEYTENFDSYKESSRNSSEEQIENIIEETYNTMLIVSDTIKAIDNYVSFVQDAMEVRDLEIPTEATRHRTTLNSYMTTTNSRLSSLLSAQSSIEDDKKSIVTAERNIIIKELTLEDTIEGATDIDIRTKSLAVETAEQELSDAYEAYDNCSVSAPFSGVISDVKIAVGESVNSGTVLGSMITNDMIATITLNEVDVTDVEIGQKANLTFDAFDDLTIEGQVYEIDTVGNVNQGVVSYDVVISFETDNEKIKSGMSITAEIIIDSVEDVLTIPTAAINKRGDKSYIEVLNNDIVEKKEIVIGLTDGISTEIKSGVTTGEMVITATNSGVSTVKTTTTDSNKETEGKMDGNREMMMMVR